VRHFEWFPIRPLAAPLRPSRRAIRPRSLFHSSIQVYSCFSHTPLAAAERRQGAYPASIPTPNGLRRRKYWPASITRARSANFNTLQAAPSRGGPSLCPTGAMVHRDTIIAVLALGLLGWGAFSFSRSRAQKDEKSQATPQAPAQAASRPASNNCQPTALPTPSIIPSATQPSNNQNVPCGVLPETARRAERSILLPIDS
jgi:hypothetical protein